jgi:hypothetical protein
LNEREAGPHHARPASAVSAAVSGTPQKSVSQWWIRNRSIKSRGATLAVVAHHPTRNQTSIATGLYMMLELLPKINIWSFGSAPWKPAGAKTAHL